MSYPRITVDLEKLESNVRAVVAHCKKENIFISGVTKAFCGNPKIAQAYINGGVRYLADSRLENLKKMKDLDVEKMMLRLPMISEADELIKYAEFSLNSEYETMRALSEAAIRAGKIHKVIIMLDLGDLREGFFYEEDLLNTVEKSMKLEGIKIAGLGTNMACYGGVIPDEESVEKFEYYEKLLREKFDLDFEILSGGNSATTHLIEKKATGIMNNLRLGETLLIGREPSYDQNLPATVEDAFNLEVEIVEIKEKPTKPVGKIGKDAFGNIPYYEDKGVRKRMICAIGKQDIDFGTMFPYDEKIEIFGGSSDHIILDGTESDIDYKVGDIVKFRLIYVSILRAMTSEFVEKVLL